MGPRGKGTGHWLVTAQPRVGEYAELTLGGVTLYSASAATLNSCIEQVRRAVAAETSDHMLFIRQILYSQVRKCLDFDLADRAFGPILGRMLKLGELQCEISLSLNFKLLRVFYNARNALRVETIINDARALLRRQKSLITSQVQDRHFTNAWGGYYMAQQICGILVYRGCAVQVDRDTFVYPSEIERAINTSGR